MTPTVTVRDVARYGDTYRLRWSFTATIATDDGPLVIRECVASVDASNGGMTIEAAHPYSSRTSYVRLPRGWASAIRDAVVGDIETRQPGVIDRWMVAHREGPA